jgi:hypothetical protein
MCECAMACDYGGVYYVDAGVCRVGQGFIVHVEIGDDWVTNRDDATWCCVLASVDDDKTRRREDVQRCSVV